MIAVGRVCAYCDGPIPATRRADTQTCSDRCRQAIRRQRNSVATVPEHEPDVLELLRRCPRQIFDPADALVVLVLPDSEGAKTVRARLERWAAA